VATAAKARPWRPLAALGIVAVLLGAWMFISGVTSPQLGLDLQGGTTVTLQPKVAPGSNGTITESAINQAVSIIDQRVNAFGVSEAQVTSQGSGSNAVIVVSVPGVTSAQLVNLVGRTARLTFRPVLQVAAAAPAPTPTPTPTPSPSRTKSPSKKNGASSSSGSLIPRTSHHTPKPKASTTPTPTPTATPNPTAPASTTITPQLQQQFATLDCTKPRQSGAGAATKDNQPIVACGKDGTSKYLLGPVMVQGSDISGASAGLPQGFTSWAVNLNFNGEGTKKFAAASQSLVNKPPPTNQFGIVLDGVVISAPVMQSAILNGQAQITGQFTQSQAQDLATVLKFGALPLTFQVGEQETVSPTLGADQLRGGLIAGAIGLLLVVIYLVIYYRALALVAVASLILAAYLTYGTVVLLGHAIGYTLTLAGVAGLIVAIGITADSFIVYFERIRDEVREGRSLRVALEAGWARARRTIVAADFISLIAAVILYILSIGGVRGFAFSLGLTTIIDLLVVFLFTKPVITLLAGTKFFNSGSHWSGLSPERLGVSHIGPAPRKRAATANRGA